MAPRREIKEVLGDLLLFSIPLPALRSQLSGQREGEQALATLERRHLKDVLGRYLAGSLLQEQVEEWANLVEGRRDIDIPNDDAIQKVLHRLANPTITIALTPESARDMVALLES